MFDAWNEWLSIKEMLPYRKHWCLSTKKSAKESSHTFDNKDWRSKNEAGDLLSQWYQVPSSPLAPVHAQLHIMQWPETAGPVANRDDCRAWLGSRGMRMSWLE
eukprot:1158982-Pelagomonas_calceolata.AAC.9